jgi:hypothetical protein
MRKKKRKLGRPVGSFVTTTKKEETVVMRIPLSKVKAVKKLIAGTNKQ